MNDGEIDYRIYEFYIDYFNNYITYSSHNWSGYIRIKYGTSLKSKIYKLICIISYGKELFSKNSI